MWYCLLYAVPVGSTFSVCGCNPHVWPSKWKLLKSIFNRWPYDRSHITQFTIRHKERLSRRLTSGCWIQGGLSGPRPLSPSTDFIRFILAFARETCLCTLGRDRVMSDSSQISSCISNSSTSSKVMMPTTRCKENNRLKRHLEMEPQGNKSHTQREGGGRGRDVCVVHSTE